ncbi:MAG: ParB N-terminal domain-containing protein [Eubacteriales bacterium]|nr:ParB N-terminal domain-containing protein [Eubacteriales bacterium]
MKNKGEMRANERRKVFDAVNLLTEDMPVSVPTVKMKNGVSMLSIDSIKPFHEHPFHLYERDRLADMIESMRTHGILNPVIVRTTEDGYEMLSGHYRQNAARLAGFTEIPAIIKKDLPDTDAYVYVIETNLMQRSFVD